jgi:capsid protein
MALNLEQIYLRSQKPRPTEAKQIPELAVNFVDRENTFHVGWGNFQELKVTAYTPRALDYYEEKLLNMVVPESWNPIENGIQLNRWRRSEGYYRPGEAPGMG